MAKSKKKRKPDPLRGFQHRPLGTKAAARRNEETRGYKNRIHELEQNERALLGAIDQLKLDQVEYLRRIAARTPSRLQYTAMKNIVQMSVLEARRLGITPCVLELAGFLDGLSDRPTHGDQVASGKSNVTVRVIDHVPGVGFAVESAPNSPDDTFAWVASPGAPTLVSVPLARTMRAQRAGG